MLSRQGLIRVRRLAQMFCICALALCTAPVRAQAWGLQGSYTLDPAAGDSIEKAVVNGTAEMNFAIRSLARGRIVKTNPPYGRIQLWRTETVISVQFDSRQAIEMPADGRPVRWAREDGGMYNISAQCSATQLVMHFNADDGQRINTLVLQPDGKTLELKVKLASPRLPGPIAYTLVYRRQ
jgi:hypothetical protein